MFNRVSIVGWGLYCACSWTWCIGMFLPIVMLDRWGWSGFLAFAVPNVIGCAAFGYVLRDRERSQRLVREHRGAMRLFSIVTLAYHVFFIGFIAWVLVPFEFWDGVRVAIVAPIALLGISAFFSYLPDRAWPGLAAIVYALSLGVFAWLGVRPLGEVPVAVAAGEMLGIGRGLLWITPALVFGFLLCPYLDLTFHRALSSSPSRHSFAVFGAAFTVMLVLSAAYWDALEGGFSWIVLGHITAQSIFTMAAHQRELLCRPADAARQPLDSLAGTGLSARWSARLAAWLAPLLALPLAFVGAFHERALEGSVDMYLRFLVFYGLLFPAYALLFMTGRQATETRAPSLAAFLIIILLAAPLYEAAFIHDLAVLAVIPPLLIVGWALVRRREAAG